MSASVLLEPKELHSSYAQLCQQLNLDEGAREKAWSLYTEVQLRERLPAMAEPLHWLVCALYMVCSQSKLESVAGGELQGAGVSLVQMLRQSQLSLTKFFSLIKIWIQRVHATPEEFQRLKLLEMKFLIVQEAFRKYKQYFLQLFKSPDMSHKPPLLGIKQQRVRMKTPCTPLEVFNFGWSLFLLTKSHFVSIADNLVHSHYLILNVLDFLFNNAVNSDRLDLLNENFPAFNDSKIDELKFHQKMNCIIPYMVNNERSIVEGCEDLASHYWSPFLTRLIEAEVLVDKKSFNAPSEFPGKLKIGLFDSSVFSKNSQSIVNAYELYVLQENQLDERIFLRDSSSSEIGVFRQQMEDLTLLENSPDTRDGVPLSKLRPPVTPLTSKSLLMPKPVDSTPFSASNVESQWLTSLLDSNGPCPSQKLSNLFNRLDSALLEIIDADVKKFLDIFSKQFYQDDNCCLPIDQVISKFVSMAHTLVYVFLDCLVSTEVRGALSMKESDEHILKIVNKDIFIRALVALSIEIVLFTHNSQKIFPWITEVLDLTGYDFSQLIQPILEYTKCLSRATVKHLSRIEERILEELIWKEDSHLWEVLQVSERPIPAWEEVMPSEQRRLIEKGVITLPRKENLGSTPLSPYPISRCFHSPAPRPLTPRIYSRLRPKPIRPDRPEPNTSEGTPSTPLSNPNIFTPKKDSVFKRVQLTPVKKECTGLDSSEISDVSLRMSAMTSFIPKSSPSTECVPPSVRREVGLQTFSTLNPNSTQVYHTNGSLKAQRKGSIAILFKKVYYLVHTRLRDLCNKLGYDIKVVQIIWTTFENCMRDKTGIFKDRHLDQILLCCVYISSRVMKLTLRFEELTAKYRTQPQANPIIYNSVLLNNDPDRDATHIPYGMRGDIVQFYNKVYLKEMETFAKDLGQEALNPSASPCLSPLPFHLTMSLPRYRRIDTCSQPIYVRTHEFVGARRETSPRKVITNPLFTPGKEMRALNQSIHERGVCKRRIDMRDEILNDDFEAILSPAKRPTAPYPMQRENIIKLLQNEMQGDSDGDMEL